MRGNLPSSRQFAVSGVLFAASLALAAAASAQPAAAQSGPQSLVGLHLHGERNNTTDSRVSGPVNFAIDTDVEAVDHDAITYTVSSSVTRVDGGVALRLVARVRVPFAQVTVSRGSAGQPLIAFNCTDGSECIPLTIVSYFNDDPNAQAPTGGTERQSTVVIPDAATYEHVHGVLCTLAKCEN
ncbi:MAG TPA: hypothetical protein VGL66_00840 [Caulobacteraceae bacterium]